MNEMTPETVKAIERLGTDVHDRVFFHKLATDHGIVAKTAAERDQLLEMATVLRQNHDASQVKSASSNSFLSGALDSLKGALREQGVSGLLTNEENEIKAAAANLAQDEELQKAACLYGDYLASIAS